MTSMVDQVAIAIFDLTSVEGVTNPWENIPASKKEWHREMARAAIAAMRDADGVLYSVLPSSEDEFDQLAGFKEFSGDSGNWFWLWAQAIDAALAESKETK
jgi:hypothetical protein